MPQFVGCISLIISVGAASPSYALTLPLVQSFGLIFPLLTIVFITSTSIVVTYVSVKAFLRERLVGVLFLGCGALVFGCTSLLTATLLGTHGPGFSAAVFVMGALLSAAFHLACAYSTRMGRTSRPDKGYLASVWLPVALLSVALIVVAALEGVLPAFYSVGKGTTGLGQVAMGVAAVAFACSSALIFTLFVSSRSRILFWYSMSLGATAAGLLGIILSNGEFVDVAMRIGWGALYLGGLFLLMSVLSAERLSKVPGASRRKPA